MPVVFGIYDFFSYAIPGVFYIVVANELLRIFNPDRSMDITQLANNLGGAVFWVIVAYVVGQLMDTFGIRWYSLFNNFHAETRAMKEFKEKNADLDIGFNLADRKILFSVIRYNKPELAQFIDGFKAISIMLNNISLALFLMGIVELIPLGAKGLSLLGIAGLAPLGGGGSSILSLLPALATFCLSWVAVNRSQLFNEWHWSAVFEQARQFGRSVPEMFGMQPKKEETSEKEKARPSRRNAPVVQASLPGGAADAGKPKRKQGNHHQN